MACIYQLNSRGGPQSFDFDITYLIPYYSYPLSPVHWETGWANLVVYVDVLYIRVHVG